MSRRITTHHDGHGLAESLEIVADEPGPGGASHYFTVQTRGPAFNSRLSVAVIHYQKGPRNELGSTPGISDSVLLAIVRDRLAAFQQSPYACDENFEALQYVEMAMSAMKARADACAARGGFGTVKP